MRTDLDHLPATKQRELERVARILFEEFGDATAQAERIDLRLFDVWPRTAKRERAMFEKLKAAYVKARYSKHYRINEDELAWLGERVEDLGRVVAAICTERIEALEKSFSV